MIMTPVFYLFLIKVKTRQGGQSFRPTHRDSLRTVLHVDPVVPVIPEALDAMVELPVEGVWLSRGGLQKEALGDLPLSGQHQHPAVNTHPVELVRWKPLQFL